MGPRRVCASRIQPSRVGSKHTLHCRRDPHVRAALSTRFPQRLGAIHGCFGSGSPIHALGSRRVSSLPVCGAPRVPRPSTASAAVFHGPNHPRPLPAVPAVLSQTPLHALFRVHSEKHHHRYLSTTTGSRPIRGRRQVRPGAGGAANGITLASSRGHQGSSRGRILPLSSTPQHCRPAQI